MHISIVSLLRLIVFSAIENYSIDHLKNIYPKLMEKTYTFLYQLNNWETMKLVVIRANSL